jgi:hypothetical protein
VCIRTTTTTTTTAAAAAAADIAAINPTKHRRPPLHALSFFQITRNLICNKYNTPS